MSTILSIRLDSDLKTKLDALAASSRRSKSFLAAEAIAAYLETEAWQISEIHHGMRELDADRSIDHEKVDTWLRSWGKKEECRPPRQFRRKPSQ